jgi:hypothetical protein
MSAEQYQKLAIETIERNWERTLKHKKSDAPIPTNYHPEVDASDLLDDNEIRYSHPISMSDPMRTVIGVPDFQNGRQIPSVGMLISPVNDNTMTEQR